MYKRVKPAKKHTKNVELKLLLTKIEDAFGLIEEI